MTEEQEQVSAQGQTSETAKPVHRSWWSWLSSSVTSPQLLVEKEQLRRGEE